MAQKETAEVEIVLSNGDKAGKTMNDLTKKVVQLYREIKTLEPGSEEFVKATQDYQKVQKRLDDVRKEVKGVDQATSELKSQFGDLIPFSAQFQKFQSTFGNITTAMGGTTKATNLFRLALISTGIGAIVVLLGSLITYLTSTQEGMDKVTAVTRPLIAIFEKMKGVVQELGGSVFKGLAQIMNGDLKEGLKTLQTGFTDSVGNVRDAITEGAEAGKQLDQLTKQIEKSEIALATNRERLNRIFEEQKFIAEDSTKTEKERVAAAREAQAAQDQLLAMEKNVLDLRIQKLEVEQSLNDTSREGHLEMAQLIGERDKLEAQAVAKKKEARNQENSILQQGVAAEKAAIAQTQKAKEEAAAKELAYKRSVEDLKIALIEDTTEREIAQLQIDTQRKIEALTGTEEQITEQKILMEQQRDAAIQAVKDQLAEKQKAKDLEKAQLTLEEKLLADEEEKIRLQEKFENSLITAEEHDEIIYEQERAALERKLALQQSIHGAESLEAKKANLDILQLDAARNAEIQENAVRTAEFKKKIEAQNLAATKDIFGGMADLLSEDVKTRKKHAGLIKAMKVAEISVGLVQEIQGIWSWASGTGPWGAALGAILTGIAAVRGGMAISKVNSQKFSLGGRLSDTYKYAKGFLAQGPSHAQGGIKLVNSQTGQVEGEMEGSEPILTKGVGKSPFLRNMVNYVNQAAGGRRIYATGGIPSMPAPVNPLTVQSNPTMAIQNSQTEQNRELREANQQNQGQDNTVVVNEIRGLRNDVATWQRELKVVNDPRQTDDVLSNIKQVENDASI